MKIKLNLINFVKNDLCLIQDTDFIMIYNFYFKYMTIRGTFNEIQGKSFLTVQICGMIPFATINLYLP